ncbi:MAG: thioredoxin [Chlamydiales bacterium]|nr:thioredoxin [Chlamydiales bacterium]
MAEDIHKFTEESFEKEIQDGVTLVDFYADWCGPCRMLAPVLEKVARDVKGKARVAKIDVDAAQRIASNFKVTSIPTLILFKGGKEAGRIVGLKDAETLKQFVLDATK